MPHGRRPVTICLSSCPLDPQYPGPAAYTPAIIPDRGQPKEAAYPRLLLLPQAQNRMPEPTFQLARSYVQVSAHVFLVALNCSVLTMCTQSMREAQAEVRVPVHLAARDPATGIRLVRRALPSSVSATFALNAFRSSFASTRIHVGSEPYRTVGSPILPFGHSFYRPAISGRSILTPSLLAHPPPPPTSSISAVFGSLHTRCRRYESSQSSLPAVVSSSIIRTLRVAWCRHIIPLGSRHLSTPTSSYRVVHP